MAEPLTEIEIIQRALRCYAHICADRVISAQKLVDSAREKDLALSLLASRNVLARQQHEYDIVQHLLRQAAEIAEPTNE